jgi:ribonucleoside-triphosphate reductase
MFDKITIEGKFHNLCNGGCITYIELGESPLGNDEGLREIIEHATVSGIHYLGFNFPLDVCDTCGESGVFDCCENCGSDKITRIRRVSGYLEILDYFTAGKKAEVKNRKKN